MGIEIACDVQGCDERKRYNELERGALDFGLAPRGWRVLMQVEDTPDREPIGHMATRMMRSLGPLADVTKIRKRMICPRHELLCFKPEDDNTPDDEA